jgi:hypothetical protein
LTWQSGNDRFDRASDAGERSVRASRPRHWNWIAGSAIRRPTFRKSHLNAVNPCGRTLRVFDTRSFDRVRQLQHSITEVQSVRPDGSAELLQRSEFDMRWVYKEEMRLLLRHTGYARWESAGISAVAR